MQFFKGFVAGGVVAGLNKKILLGALIGIVGGAYYHQEFGAPNVKANVDKVKAMVLDAVEKSKKQ